MIYVISRKLVTITLCSPVVNEYLPRLVDTLLQDYLAELPAVMLVGPRACGKTTTAARLAGSVVRLDSDAAAAFRIDADAALAGRPEPVLLDEWQLVPEVLGAVKRAVDAERRPGRFVITGSARADVGDGTWPGTGRVVLVNMGPLTVAEQHQRHPVPFIDRVSAGALEPSGVAPALDLRDYLGLALRGGFPEPALQLGDDTSRAWLESYAHQVALRDARTHGETPDAARLGRYLEACAINSAGAAHHKTIYDTAGISRHTAIAYDSLLRELMVIDELPAWSSNRAKRLSRTPKRYVIDSGLLGGILRVGIDDMLASGDLIGRFVDTFVVAQLRAEAATSRTRYRLSHLRSADGRHEIDIVAEVGGGRIIGIEVKASAGVRRSDARHLRWLSDQLGDRFVAGVVLHSGHDIFELDDRILAAPISALWS